MGGSTDQVPGVVSGGGAESSSSTMEASSSGSGGAVRSSARASERVRSVVEDQGVYKSTCGYCKATSRTSVAQGLWAYSLTVHDYQDLLDRGWRRSGMFLYKPQMKSTCCPPYTIRLKAESFVASKDQMRVLRRMERYLDGNREGVRAVGELYKEKHHASERAKGLPSNEELASVSDRNSSSCESSSADLQLVGMRDLSGTAVTEEEGVLKMLKGAIQDALRNCVESGLLPSMLDLQEICVKPVSQRMKDKLKNVEGEVDFTSNIAFTLMAALKRRSKDESQSDENLKEQQAELKPQELANLLAGKLLELSGPYGFTVKASKGHLNFLSRDNKVYTSNSFEQGSQVCKIDSGKSSTGSKKDFPGSVQFMVKALASTSQLEVRMKRSSFDAEEFALYKRYQVSIHNDRPQDVKESSYRRFLVDSPLIFVRPSNDGTTPACGFGSFHQQYLIDGRLVAVGVIDILPHCLSSKYLFWDPDFAFLSLGKYSALQEIKWVQEAQKVCPSLEYYYLGFYIHSCPKMRYKAAYFPSELLCPERYRWVAYEVASPLLDNQSYVCLSDIVDSPLLMTATSSSPGIKRDRESVSFSDLEDENRESDVQMEVDFAEVEDQKEMDGGLEPLIQTDPLQAIDDSTDRLGEIQLYLDGACLPFKHLQELGLTTRWHLDALVHHLQRYLQAVGPSLATRMGYAFSTVKRF